MNPFKIIFLLLISHSIYSQIELWGMSTGNKIFKYLPENNAIELMHDFYEPNYHPIIQYLTKTSSGKYIGVSSSGGQFGFGAIIEYKYTNNTFNILYNFSSEALGYGPRSKLIEVSNGILYGIASGGNFKKGVLFSFNTTNNEYLKEYDFQDFGPIGPIIFDNNKLFFVSEGGGTYNFGAFIQYDLSTKTKSNIYNFDGTSIGKFPRNSLCKTANGKIFGYCIDGGTGNKGAIFEYNITSNLFSKKIDLQSFTNANAFPYGNLLEANDGFIYGVTSGGGISNAGTVFKFDPILNTITKVNEFNGNITGTSPEDGFKLGSNNKLYVATSNAFVEYDNILNTLTKKHTFQNFEGMVFHQIILTDNPNEILGSYISNLQNFMFKFDISSDTFSNIYEFDQNTYGNLPFGSLLLANDGNFYGMTYNGGLFDKGIIFKYNPITNSYTKIFDFNGTNGANPNGSLVQAPNGFLYGLAGGANNGVIFKFELQSNVYTIVHYFTSYGVTYNGNSPQGSLSIGQNGILYGTTLFGGGQGNIFQFNTNNESYATLYNLTPSNSNPYDAPILASNGKLYGFTSGLWNFSAQTEGTLYEFNLINNSYNDKINFWIQQGRTEPKGRLMEGNDNYLYGLTDYSNSLFKYNPINNNFISLHTFNRLSDGANPHGTPMQAIDGNIYGLTRFGGLFDKGTIFKYNPISNEFSKMYDFDGIFGANPYYTQLTQRYVTLSTIKSGNWNDPTVWETGVVPSNTSYITINTNHIIDIDGVPVAVKYVDLKGTVNLLNGGSLNLVE